MDMSRGLIQVATLLALAGTCGAAGSGAPQAISARFDVLMNGMRVGTMNEKYEAKDGYYRIVSDTRPIGLIALFVGGKLAGDQPRPPDRYRARAGAFRG